MNHEGDPPVTHRCGAVHSDVPVLVVFEQHLQDVQHHGELAEEGHSVTLRKTQVVVVAGIELV